MTTHSVPAGYESGGMRNKFGPGAGLVSYVGSGLVGSDRQLVPTFFCRYTARVNGV